MHQLATGLSGSDGPPVSTDTIGRAPSSYDAPVPLRSLEEIVGSRVTPKSAEAQSSKETSLATAVDQRRLVVRLLGGEDVELGSFDDPEEAMQRAKELVATLADAEAAGEWPEVGGRFLRPASIVSVDILVAGG